MKKAKLREEKKRNAPGVTCYWVLQPTCYWVCTLRCNLARSAICTKDAGSKTSSLWNVRGQWNVITVCSNFSSQIVPRPLSPMVITSQHSVSLKPSNQSSVPTWSITNTWESLVETANWRKWLQSPWSWSRTTSTLLGLSHKTGNILLKINFQIINILTVIE